MPTMLQHPRFSACCQRSGLIFLLLIILQLPAQAQYPEKIRKLVKAAALKKSAAVDSIVAGNKIYQIVLENKLESGVGLFTVRTGRSHPIGGGRDLLGGGGKGETGTSYITVRSYSRHTDYVQSDFIENAPGFKTAWLDSLLILTNNLTPVQPITNSAGDTTGYEVIYDLPGSPLTADKMCITVRVNVHGVNFADSWVEITTKVKNTGNRTLEIGIRYLFDLKIDEDDGAVVSESALGGDFGNTEAEFDWVNFAYFRAEANETIKTLPPPGYHVYGSAITPTNLLRTPHQPTLLQHVSWPLAFLRPFSYAIHENFIVTKDVNRDSIPEKDRTGGDNAILYFWGETADDALIIDHGQSVQVTQALLASPPDDRPPLYDFDFPRCDLTAVNPGPPKSFEFLIQDEISGIRLLRAMNDFNATIEIPRFPTGATESVRVVGTVIDETKPFGFIVRVVDMCGNEVLCDPVFLTLRPELRVFEHRFDLLPSDRYFHLKNQGLRRLVANLNGHQFILSAESRRAYRMNNTFMIPLYGEILIDMFRYLKPEGNTISIAFEGPEGSRGDLVIADMKLKNDIDTVLDLAPVPQEFALQQNLPNPFRGTTTIRFEVPELNNAVGAPRVELKIYNVLGQVVRTLIDAELQPGAYTATWNGRDARGRPVAAGVYFYNLNANGLRITKKMALIQ